MNVYDGKQRVKMMYSVFHTQLHHDSRQVYRNLSYTIDEILGLAKVPRLAETSTGSNQAQSVKMSAGVVVEFGP